MMQVASMLLGLVLTQALLISRSTHSAILLFFQIATTVVVIVNLAHIKDCEEKKKGAYVQNEMNIQANASSTLLPQSSVQKEGAYFRSLLILYPL